jgi:hypothetical protein
MYATTAMLCMYYYFLLLIIFIYYLLFEYIYICLYHRYIIDYHIHFVWLSDVALAPAYCPYRIRTTVTYVWSCRVM